MDEPFARNFCILQEREADVGSRLASCAGMHAVLLVSRLNFLCIYKGRAGGGQAKERNALHSLLSLQVPVDLVSGAWSSSPGFTSILGLFYIHFWVQKWVKGPQYVIIAYRPSPNFVPLHILIFLPALRPLLPVFCSMSIGDVGVMICTEDVSKLNLGIASPPKTVRSQ
jgi:hypothetical protein